MKLIVIAGAVLLTGIAALYAEPVSNRVGAVVGGERKPADQSPDTTQLIAELNAVETNFFVDGVPCTNIGTETNRLTTGTPEQRLRSFNLKRQLAEQGVTIRYVDGYYLDATTNAENGHALNKEVRRILAGLNFREQTDGIVARKIRPNLVDLGEGNTRILETKYQLADRGICVSWDRTNEFYFVASTQAPPARPTAKWPWDSRKRP